MTEPKTETKIEKPLPLPDAASEPFFTGGREGKLMLMRCDDCGTARLPSRQHCDLCLSPAFSWFEASGRGRIRTFAVMHQRYHPGFTTPYNVAYVELEEGPRLPTNIVGIANEDLRVGMAVEVEWEQHEDVAIPQFRPSIGNRA